MRARMPLFMLSVGCISITSLALVNLAADRLGDSLPALTQFDYYITRKNG